jgi:hypothetical protein
LCHGDEIARAADELFLAKIRNYPEFDLPDLFDAFQATEPLR